MGGILRFPTIHEGLKQVTLLSLAVTAACRADM
jgi:hypothetical protein